MRLGVGRHKTRVLQGQAYAGAARLTRGVKRGVMVSMHQIEGTSAIK